MLHSQWNLYICLKFSRRDQSLRQFLLKAGSHLKFCRNVSKKILSVTVQVNDFIINVLTNILLEAESTCAKCFKKQFISDGLPIGFMVTVTKPLETFQTTLYKMNFFTGIDTLLFHLEKKKIKFQRSSGNRGSLIFLLIWYTKAYDFVPFFLAVHVCNLYLTLTWSNH